MNNNDSKHTPIITLEEIARRKSRKTGGSAQSEDTNNRNFARIICT